MLNHPGTGICVFLHTLLPAVLVLVMSSTHLPPCLYSAQPSPMKSFCSVREHPTFPDISPAFNSCLSAEQIGLKGPVRGCVIVVSATPRQNRHEYLAAVGVSPAQMLGMEGAWYEALVFSMVTPSVWGPRDPKALVERADGQSRLSRNVDLCHVSRFPLPSVPGLCSCRCFTTVGSRTSPSCSHCRI